MEATLFDFPKLEITNKIRLIELFGGIGSQAMALRDIGADFEHYRLVEFDKYAVASYNAIHGTSFETADIRNVHGTDLGIVERETFTYIMTYSFPCFTGDTLVLTDKGVKQIKDVNTGDLVLTHTNKYEEVLAARKTGTKNIFKIKGMGIDEIKCTENHRFYVREMSRYFPHYGNGKRGNCRRFSEPKWVECKDLTKKHYLGIAINQKEVIPEWNGINFEWTDGRKTRHKNELSKLMNNHSFWWIIGRYLGDGWTRQQGGIIICCAKDETIEILPHLRNCNFNYSISEERTANKIHIALKELQMFVEQFGKGAKNKKLPGFIFDMPCDLLQSLFEGYTSADGYVHNGLIKVSSISRELIYGFAQVVAKVYKTPYRIYKNKRNPIVIIEGRKCHQQDGFELVFKTEKKKQDKAFYENGFIWFPIQSIENTKQIEEVYDIETESAHSFTANGVIVHNCTDLSVAGKMKGMSKAEWEQGNSTRSGLLWEVERILKELKADELPQVLLMENVPQVHAEQNRADFEAWLAFLRSRGYFNFYQDLNAKDYGIPQNRDRCFCVSILSPEFIDYEFPEVVKLEKVIKDFLEDEVEEKYYINNEKAKKLIETLKESNQLDGIEKEAVDGTINDPKVRTISNAITTRISASGICNHKQESMAVIQKDISQIIIGGLQEHQTSRKDGVADIVDKKLIVRMTGRNPDNPKSRKLGLPTEQMIEPNAQGICGTLTTVQKDNLVLEAKTTRGKNICSTIRSSYFKNGERNIVENVKNGKGYEGVIEIKQATKEGTIKCKVGGCYDASFPGSTTQRGRVQEGGDVAPTLTASSSENIHYVETQYRIRKLTPRECWRLMGYTDADFERANEVNSATQLYKQAGNAIVKQVLMAIFAQMIPESARKL